MKTSSGENIKEKLEALCVVGLGTIKEAEKNEKLKWDIKSKFLRVEIALLDLKLAIQKENLNQ